MSIKVSVVLPVFNGQAFLRPALESILNQTFRNFELIVIDDGSTDNSLEIMREYGSRDERVVVVEQKNSGIVAALNNGIARSQGEYIARMDADDIALPTRLEEQASYLDSNPLVAVLGTQMLIFKAGVKKQRKSRYPCDPNDVAKAFKKGRNPICHPSVMMRKAVLEQIGGYRSCFNAAQDYDLWLRVINKFSIANLPKVLLRYRSHDNSITQQKAEEQNYFRALATYFSEKRAQGRQDPLEEMGGKIDPSCLKDGQDQIELNDVLEYLNGYAQFKSGEADLHKLTNIELSKSIEFLSRGIFGGGRKDMAKFCEALFHTSYNVKLFSVSRKALRIYFTSSPRVALLFSLHNANKIISIYFNRNLCKTIDNS